MKRKSRRKARPSALTVRVPAELRPHLQAEVDRGIIGLSQAEVAIYLIRDGLALRFERRQARQREIASVIEPMIRPLSLKLVRAIKRSPRRKRRG